MKVDDRISQAIESMRNEACDPRSMDHLKLALHAKLDELDREVMLSAKSGVDRRRLLKLMGLGALAASGAFMALDPVGFFAPQSLYAQAVDNLQRGGLYFVITKEGQSQGTEVWVAADGRRRHATPAMVTISDKFGNPLLMYTIGDHVQKSATRFKITPKSSVVRFEEGWMKPLKDESHAELIGDESIADGAMVKHYRVTPPDPSLVFEVWIDPKSKLLVRVEFEEDREFAPAEARGKYLITDIKCDKTFDESLFDLTPPKGYEVTFIDETTNPTVIAK